MVSFLLIWLLNLIRMNSSMPIYWNGTQRQIMLRTPTKFTLRNCQWYQTNSQYTTTFIDQQNILSKKQKSDDKIKF